MKLIIIIMHGWVHVDESFWISSIVRKLLVTYPGVWLTSLSYSWYRSFSWCIHRSTCQFIVFECMSACSMFAVVSAIRHLNQVSKCHKYSKNTNDRRTRVLALNFEPIADILGLFSHENIFMFGIRIINNIRLIIVALHSNTVILTSVMSPS